MESVRFPDAVISEFRSSPTSTLLGRDYPGVKARILTEEGARVRAGDAVLCDRRRPQILFTSPVSGTVSAIRLGKRRRLISLKIVAEGSDQIVFDIPAKPDRDSLRGLMLKTGLWASLRSRPFGHIPNPDAAPEALLITAIDTQPLAPDPGVIINQYPQDFSRGLRLLCDLIEAPVYLCQSTGADFRDDKTSRAIPVGFDGPHPAGLVSTHINALGLPVSLDKEVWHIGYQDVISLGRLFNTGTAWYQRVVSLAGSAVREPRLITVTLGAGLKDIVEGELIDGESRLISGSVLSGHNAVGDEAGLGRLHHQVTAMLEAELEQPQSWFSSLFNSDYSQSSAPLIATPDLDDAAPPGILAVPLLRALLVGDVERARELGALELVEDDLALLSYICSSGVDYGSLLREVLNQIVREELAL